MTPRPIAIIGAGGHGGDVHDVLVEAHDHEVRAGREGYECIGFYDDGEVNHELLTARGASWLGPMASYAETPADVSYLIAIASPAVRRRVDEWASALGRMPATLVHPKAVIGRFGVRIGPGSLIMAHVTMTTNITLGRHVHVNQNSTIGHDSVLGDYVTIGAITVVCGGGQLEGGVEVGSGAVINPRRRVGRDAVVGAGSVVTRDVAAGAKVVGVPARPMSR